MIRFENAVLSKTAPDSPNLVWMKPEGDSFKICICLNGEWKELSSKVEDVTVDGVSVVDNKVATLPEIPELSTDVTSDGTSDTKASTPKSVKTYVDGQNIVKYSEQALTDAQKMQARANQGLYYSYETSGEKTIDNITDIADAITDYSTIYCVPETTTLTSLGFFKVSDDTPATTDWLSIVNSNEFEEEITSFSFIPGDGYYMVLSNGNSPLAIVVTTTGAEFPFYVYNDQNELVTVNLTISETGIFVYGDVSTNRSENPADWSGLFPRVFSLAYSGTVTAYSMIPEQYVPKNVSNFFNITYNENLGEWETSMSPSSIRNAIIEHEVLVAHLTDENSDEFYSTSIITVGPAVFIIFLLNPYSSETGTCGNVTITNGAFNEFKIVKLSSTYSPQTHQNIISVSVTDAYIPLFTISQGGE